MFIPDTTLTGKVCLEFHCIKLEKGKQVKSVHTKKKKKSYFSTKT